MSFLFQFYLGGAIAVAFLGLAVTAFSAYDYISADTNSKLSASQKTVKHGLVILASSPVWFVAVPYAFYRLYQHMTYSFNIDLDEDDFREESEDKELNKYYQAVESQRNKNNILQVDFKIKKRIDKKENLLRYNFFKEK